MKYAIIRASQDYGYRSCGNEVLYSGITGEQLKSSIFMGPIYYQRIKIMVADKILAERDRSKALIRQPAAGRANNGGLRIGGMERDSILSHGISNFLSESMMKRSMNIEFKSMKQRGKLITPITMNRSVRFNYRML